MTAAAEKDERRKKMKEFFNMMLLPVVLGLVNSSFFRMAMFSFTGQAIDGSPGLHLRFTYQMLVMFLLVYLWARPAYQYVDKPDDKLRETVRRRIGSVYRDAFLMLGIVQAVSMAISYAVSGLASGARVAAAAAALLAQAAVLVVYIDSHLSKQKDLMEALYSAEELSRLRHGFAIPVYIKFSLMVFGFAIIPFVLIFAAVYRAVPMAALAPALYDLLLLSAIILLVGLDSVYYGIQKPLDGLIGKMKRVAGGDYGVKTRIYFSDEVGCLKAGFNEMVDGLKEREDLQDTFGKYLSIEIARELIKNKKVNLGGEAMEAAVMFCDIRNFTPLSESMDAGGVVEFLNNYFRYITPAITLHHGVINKFIGDAVMAVFTPLLGSNDYAADAIRAAAGMRASLVEFNASGKAPVPVSFGIGVHAGRLIAGNIGTFSRLEYTFIGDTVNIASRLQSKTKDLGTDIIVSEAALAKARGSLGGSVLFEPLGKAMLKGKTEAVEIYKVA